MNFDQPISRLGTHCVKYSEGRMRQRPQDALVMTLADMDLPCCPAITEAISARLEHPIFGYQQFDEQLPKQVAGWYRDAYGAQLNSSDCVVTGSVNTAVAAAIRAFSQPKDQILIQNPSYSPFRKAVELNDRRCLLNELKQCGDHVELDRDDFEEKCRSARMFILCHPHNPTGKVFDREELKIMLGLCRKHGVLVIADEIHCDWSYGPIHSASSVDPDIITLVSSSKTFNLQGLQTSFAFIPDPDMRSAFRRELDALSLTNNLTFSHVVCMAAYTEQGRAWLEEAKAYVLGNYQWLCDYIERHQLPLKPMRLEATFLLWLDCSGCCQNDEEVVRLFEKECHVFGTSGSHYHINEPFIRLNIGVSRRVIEELADRLKRALISN